MSIRKAVLVLAVEYEEEGYDDKKAARELDRAAAFLASEGMISGDDSLNVSAWQATAIAYPSDPVDDSRHPYTHSADLLRAVTAPGSGGVTLSRSDATAIRNLIAESLGMSTEVLAHHLATVFKSPKGEQIVEKSTEALMRVMEKRPTGQSSAFEYFLEGQVRAIKHLASGDTDNGKLKLRAIEQACDGLLKAFE